VPCEFKTLQFTSSQVSTKSETGFRVPGARGVNYVRGRGIFEFESGQFGLESGNEVFGGLVKNVSISNSSSEMQPDKYNKQRTTYTKQPDIRCGKDDPANVHYLWNLLTMYLVTISFDCHFTQRAHQPRGRQPASVWMLLLAFICFEFELISIPMNLTKF